MTKMIPCIEKVDAFDIAFRTMIEIKASTITLICPRFFLNGINKKYNIVAKQNVPVNNQYTTQSYLFSFLNTAKLWSAEHQIYKNVISKFKSQKIKRETRKRKPVTISILKTLENQPFTKRTKPQR